MRLGNSNGNNKGKKYIKNRLLSEAKFEDEARCFNQWFIHNASILNDHLFKKYTHANKEDAFQETYLRMYERILFTGESIDNYRSYFCRAFYTNYMKSFIESDVEGMELCADVPNNKSDETNADIELNTKRKELEDDILDYVFSKYELREFELFKMYVRLKPAVNYSRLSQITKVKEHQIAAIIGKIKNDLKEHKEFNKRNKELL